MAALRCRKLCFCAVLLGLAGPAGLFLPRGVAYAQDDVAEQRAQEALSSPTAESEAAEPAAIPTLGEAPSINVLDLVFKGGWLGLPIGIMSLIVVAVGIERGLALRRNKVMPPELLDGLGEAAQQGGFDPRKAYRLCQQYPSTAAIVIRSMLLKVGRPHAEVERAVAEASEREAARLYSHVRTLNLAAAITPLMGLLGTVWGMIKAFFATANMPASVNKAQLLADGIYIALVTTAAGLMVAIPAAMLAHYFEGRIQSLFREIEDLLFSLLPQVERFEGKLRVSRQQLAKDGKAGENGADEAEARRPAPSAAK